MTLCKKLLTVILTAFSALCIFSAVGFTTAHAEEPETITFTADFTQITGSGENHFLMPGDTNQLYATSGLSCFSSEFGLIPGAWPGEDNTVNLRDGQIVQLFESRDSYFGYVVFQIGAQSGKVLKDMKINLNALFNSRDNTDMYWANRIVICASNYFANLTDCIVKSYNHFESTYNAEFADMGDVNIEVDGAEKVYIGVYIFHATTTDAAREDLVNAEGDFYFPAIGTKLKTFTATYTEREKKLSDRYGFTETIVNRTVLNSSDELSQMWSFADDFNSAEYTAIQAGPLGVKYSFKFNASNSFSADKYFSMIFGPSNKNNDGAAVCWDGIATVPGQFRLIFLVQASNEGVCPIYAWPCYPSNGEPIIKPSEWKDWAMVGSCRYGESFDFDISIAFNGENYDLTIGNVNLDKSFDEQANAYFNTYVGSLFKNSESKTNIAFNYYSGSGPLPGELVFKSYSAISDDEVAVSEESSKDDQLIAWTILGTSAFAGIVVLTLAITLIVKTLKSDLAAFWKVLFTLIIVAVVAGLVVFGLPFICKSITELGGLVI
ncbi:MAG: hypothetical protein SPL13_04260 [Clostridia bacterium]|nr:hypothetical protein [Clostridia bacterium]